MNRAVRNFLAACLLVVAVPAAAQTSPDLATPDGKTISWADWTASHGPTVVLLWASWVPDKDFKLETVRDIARAAHENGFGFLLIAVQEPAEDSRAALAGTDHEWLHDRHGIMLRRLRVYHVPALVLVDAEGTVTARGEARAEEVAGWR